MNLLKPIRGSTKSDPERLKNGGFVKRCIEAISVIALLVGPLPVLAQAPWNGMSIYEFCMGDTVLFDGTTCRAYIQGVTDAYDLIKTKGSQFICIPKEKNKREEGEALVIQWLDFFKERKTEKPITLIFDALKAIFPCTKNKIGSGP